jgi:hypothetical protein
MTKLILILAIGVALAFVLRYVTPDRTISFYSSTPYGGAEAAHHAKTYWEAGANVLAFWLCLIMTLIVVAVLGGRMLLRSSWSQ